MAKQSLRAQIIKVGHLTDAVFLFYSSFHSCCEVLATVNTLFLTLVCLVCTMWTLNAGAVFRAVV